MRTPEGVLAALGALSLERFFGASILIAPASSRAEAAGVKKNL